MIIVFNLFCEFVCVLTMVSVCECGLGEMSDTLVKGTQKCLFNLQSWSVVNNCVHIRVETLQ